jgi:hypothetical protein
VINLKTAKQIGVTIPQKVLGHVWLNQAGTATIRCRVDGLEGPRISSNVTLKLN